MKKIFVLMMFLSVFMLNAYSVDNTKAANDILNEIKDTGYEIISMYNDILWERKFAVYKFLVKNIPAADVEKNETLIDFAPSYFMTRVKLNDLLKKYYSSKSERERRLNTLKFKNFPERLLNSIPEKVVNAIHYLREPLNNDEYKYAKWEMRGETIEKNDKIKVSHLTDDLQRYSKKFNTRVYKIKFYSLNKIDMFKGNRDYYIEKVVVNFMKNGKPESFAQDFKRWMRRGESFETVFPYVVNSPEIIVYVGTKREHRNRAFMGMEIKQATLADDTLNPNYSLIQKLKELHSITAGDIKLYVSSFKSVLNELGAADTKVPSDTVVTTTKVDLGDKSDQIKYFYYLLQDSSNSREFILEKYKSLFGL